MGWRLRLAIGASAGALASCSMAGPAVAKRHGHPAKPRPHGAITGRLSQAGYSIVAFGTNGKMTASKAQSFSLTPPAPRYTLQLVNAHGMYAGPVVVGGGARKVIVGLKGGVHLGTIDVIAARGYARTKQAVPSGSLVQSLWAWASGGVPIGNGNNLGLVKSPTKGTGPSGPGGDSDRSGIPNAFDVASNGQGVLNALVPASLTHAARPALVRPWIRRPEDGTPQPPAGGTPQPPAGGTPQPPAGGTPQPPAGGTPQPPAGGTPQPPAGGTPQPPAGGTPQPPAGGTPQPPAGGTPQPASTPNWMSQLFLPMDQTVNEDAAGVSQAEIDSTLQANLDLKLLNLPTGDPVELDCNGLSFCSPGGTGMAAEEGIAPAAGTPGNPQVPFPATTLDPATGFGEIVGSNVPAGFLGTLTGSGAQEFSLFPVATSSQIGSGDVITLDSTSSGATTQTPTTINFVFTTVPAITSYADTAGDSGSVTYPDTAGLGTQSNPIKVAPGPNGDVTVTFNLYRPQRAGIAGAGEPSFMDIGHLWYSFDSVSAPAPGQTTVGAGSAPQCPTSSYASAGAPLSLLDGGSGANGFSTPTGDGMLVDASSDLPANPANTITFTIDISACMAAKQQTFPVGQPVMFDIAANSQSSSDHANQTFWLERTS